MFIAHLPSGYLLRRFVARFSRVPLWPALLGSVFPDIDLFYFYLWDERRHNHHTYWIHIPFYWLLGGVVALLILRLAKRPRAFLVTAMFILAGVTHLILDTVVGGIAWGYPVTDELIYAYRIAPRLDWWVLNFILHPSFVLEVAIVLSAAWVYRCDKRALG